jgi:hypothetical protein
MDGRYNPLLFIKNLNIGNMGKEIYHANPENDAFMRVDFDGVRYFNDVNRTIKHRKGKPAVILNNGCEEYWDHGRLHNLEGPAITTKNGKQVYYLGGRRLNHRQWLEAKNKFSLNEDLISVNSTHEDNR